jgi:hypothetical protein
MATDHATRGRSNRNRGARAEVQVVNYLRQWYPDARRYLAGDGRQPGDIDCHPLLVIEVKDCAASAWPTWCRQAAAAAPPGTVPVVVRRTRGVTDVGQWECRVEWYRWLRVSGGKSIYGWTYKSGWWDHPDGGWWGLPFADLVAAVRQLDEGAA